MRNPLIAVAAVVVALLIFPQAAQAQEPVPAEPYTGSFLCLPDAYPVAPSDCLPYGPSETLTHLAKQGLHYPPRPLVAKKPPVELAASPVFLAKINLDPALPVALYATLDDAVAGTNAVRTIAPGNGLRYVSYIQEARVKDNPYVMIKSGEWVRASPAGSSDFQGLLFSRTPSTGFGWVIDTIRARSSPSFTAPEVGELIQRETPITIYDVVEAEGMEWYLIGIDQWVPYLKARRARVDPTPPPGVTGDRWISVDLYDQIVMVYENRQLVFATLVSTGGELFFYPAWPVPDLSEKRTGNDERRV